MKRIDRSRTRTPTLAAIGVVVAAAAWADEPTWLSGTWFGERNGYEVTWSFEAAGRMRLEERSAAWTVRQDTLVVDFDSFGDTAMTERAVYRFLLSNPQQGPRRMYLRGFDLGLEGLLLTREEEAADAPDHEGATDRDGEPAPNAGDETDTTKKSPRRAP